MSEATIIHHIATKLQIRPNQIQAALDLFADGNTIPFVARYRKEATGLLDEQQLRHIKEEYAYEEALASRKESVRQSIEEQGCWTKELEKRSLTPNCFKKSKIYTCLLSQRKGPRPLWPAMLV